MKNDIVRCECVDMAIDGSGIAKCGDLVVFVKEMIKGEIANVRITKEKKSYSYGIIDELIEASPERVASDCPIAYKCGGCDFRHISYDYQLKLKKEILTNILKPFEVLDIVPDEVHYYYRNKVQIPYRDAKMGFYRKYSNDIVEFDDCLIESRTANQIIKDLKELLKEYPQAEKIRHILIKQNHTQDETMLGFIAYEKIDQTEIINTLVKKYPSICSVILNINEKETNVILGEEEILLYGKPYIMDEFYGISVKVSLKSFYQVNYRQMLKLYELIRELSGCNENSRVLDLYCGIGTISLFMAKSARQVTGVEIVKEAVLNAVDNALNNGIGNVDFVLADASKGMDHYLKDKDIVIVDPPRKGLSNELIDSLIQNKTERIVYVSCNPQTLARDLKLFEKDYHISEIHPVDMFPYTIHCECVVRLDKK
ncbi:MAG: 23S rRNA (uracil(1939)-C(5))-methyltransferase RlmD [Erysipelotrichaceae bacterium]|nr:23S rRNA (uracil(1939)-C(5))-methyltransferase RlmD [Erysipelotrichaceae bacterium]